MPSLLEVYNLRYGGSLKPRVTVAIAKACFSIFAEPGSTSNHAERVAWAKSALQNTTVVAESMMWAVISDSAILAAGNSATDGEIVSAVNSFIDIFALSGA